MSRLNLLTHINPTRFFITASSVLFLFFNLVTPPLQAPDELNHFYRACQIADGHLLPQKQDQRLGGKIPFCVNDFITPYTFAATDGNYKCDKKELMTLFRASCTDTARVFRDFPNTAYYSPVSYLPQVLAMVLLKPFHCVAINYYGGRLFSFLFWLFCMLMAIRLLPVFKWLFTFVLLLPMNLYLANSFSADTVTNCLAILFLAVVMRLVLDKEQIGRKQMILLGVILFLLGQAKVVYAGLAVLLLLLPVASFKTKQSYVLSLLLLFCAAFLPAILWSNTVMQFYITFPEYNADHNYMVGLSPCGNYHAQKAYILHHGFYFFKVVYHSLVNHPFTYLTGYIGLFGQSDVVLPGWIYVIPYLAMLLLIFSDRGAFVFTLFQKSVITIAMLLSLVLLLLSQHLIWDCVGEGVVDLLQGRYLIPILPLLFLLLSSRLRLAIQPIWLIVPMLLLMYSFSFSAIYQRFYEELSLDTFEFSCDMESTDMAGKFKTDNPAVQLDGAFSKTGEPHRSGNSSVLLTPAAPYGLTYRFSDLHKGDRVDMECWEKGTGALLVLQGEGQRCEPFYFAAKEVISRDKNGWLKLRTAFTFDRDCDSLQAGVYVWNSGKNNVYIDDVRFRIKRANRLK